MKSRESVIADLNKGIHYNYYPFYGHHQKTPGVIDSSCLSQWFPAEFTVDGIRYQCAEQFMMASKARTFHDDQIEARIMSLDLHDLASGQSSIQAEIKRLGRRVHNFDQNVWASVRTNVVVAGNLAKFSQNKDLAAFLIRTGDSILVEGAPRDTIWGIGLGVDNPNAHDPRFWRGLNLLGFCLTEVKEQIVASSRRKEDC